MCRITRSEWIGVKQIINYYSNGIENNGNVIFNQIKLNLQNLKLDVRFVIEEFI